MASNLVVPNGKTLSLETATLVNFYTRFNGTVKTAEMLFWYNLDGELTLENVSYSKEMVYNSKGDEYHAQSEMYPAARYDDTIFACPHLVDEDGNHYYGEIIAYGPEVYAQNKIGSNAKSAETCKRMVIYGEYAKIYFANKKK